MYKRQLEIIEKGGARVDAAFGLVRKIDRLCDSCLYVGLKALSGKDESGAGVATGALERLEHRLARHAGGGDLDEPEGEAKDDNGNHDHRHVFGGASFGAARPATV